MRRIVIVLIVFVVTLLGNVVIVASEEADIKNEHVLKNTDYTVSIMEVVPKTATPDGDCLAVRLEWSHNTDSAKTFWLSVAVDAYQGEMKLVPLFLQTDLDEQLKEIDSGLTQEVKKTFQLSDSKSNVQVLVKIPGLGDAEQDEMIVEFPLM